MAADLRTAYDLIAQEYYDQSHQTSRNFDATTAVAVADLEIELPEGLVLEVGAGRGRAHEYLGVDPAKVVQLDSSMRMLEIEPREQSLLRVHHASVPLPFPNRTFSAIVGFLCDPFFDEDFASEARRVLRAGGLLLGTAPAYAWGQALRPNIGVDEDSTRFVLATGLRVEVPSKLRTEEALQRLLSDAGFTEIEVASHCLPPGTLPLSPDIERPAAALGISAYELPIVTLFLARAAGSG